MTMTVTLAVIASGTVTVTVTATVGVNVIVSVTVTAPVSVIITGSASTLRNESSRQKKKTKKQFVANLNEGLNGPLHFATHVARCTLYSAYCTLQAASGSRQFAIESCCLKKPQPLIDFRIEDFPKGWIWIKSEAESSAAFMRSRSIRYVKYLNELRMDMQLSGHRQEKGEAEKEWERERGGVGAGWHASLTSWHVQLEASACLTLLWLTATRRHTIYDIRCSAYGIRYCTQCNCCWAGVKSIRDVATPKAVPCPTILCIIIIAFKLWSPIMPW